MVFRLQFFWCSQKKLSKLCHILENNGNGSFFSFVLLVMNFLHRNILLLAVCACVNFSLADGLPGGLDDAGNLVVAWELNGVFKNEDQQAYVALGDTDYIDFSKILPAPSPDGQDDRLAIQHGVNYYSLISYRIRQNSSFMKSWKLCIYTQDQMDCPITLTRVHGALPDNATLKLLDSEGRVVADWSAVKSAVALTVAPGDYVLTAEMQFFEATVTTEVFPGWNLLATPFDETRGGEVDSRMLLADVPLYQVSEKGVWERVSSWDGMLSGNGFWLYWDGREQAEVSLKGLCRPGNVSVMAKGVAGKWNFVGLQGAFEGDKKALAPPTGKVPKGNWIWNALASRYLPAAEETPVFGKGYLLH